MLTPFLIYATIGLSVVIAFLAIVEINLAVLPTTTQYEPQADTSPQVAVLIPARNEAANIEACLRSLLAQDHPNLAVWLYDDASTDDTLVIAQQIAASTLDTGQLNLRIVEGKEGPPPGWLGKANALHKLYAVVKANSSPEYLLFTDADVQFEPNAISHALSNAQAWDAGLLSIFPRQTLGSFAERLAVPLMLHWTVYNFLPLPVAFSRKSGPGFAAANGQFMLFRREAYEASGGHEGVKSQILEDVALSRAVKKAGYRAILADGGSTVHTRMYRGVSEVWRGYSKNAYAFFNYKPYFLALGVAVLAALYLLPLPLAILALSRGDVLVGALLLAQYLIAVATRLVLAMRFAFPVPDAFLHPLAVAFMIAIQVNSMVWSLTKRGDWKGRGTGTTG